VVFDPSTLALLLVRFEAVRSHRQPLNTNASKPPVRIARRYDLRSLAVLARARSQDGRRSLAARGSPGVQTEKDGMHERQNSAN